MGIGPIKITPPALMRLLSRSLFCRLALPECGERRNSSSPAKIRGNEKKPANRRIIETTKRGPLPVKTGSTTKRKRVTSPIITDTARSAQPETRRKTGRNLFKDFIIKIIE